MPIKLAELQRQERTIPVAFDGQEAQVTYKPHVITLALLNSDISVPAAIQATVIAWDVVDAAGQPVPITEAGLAPVPWALLQAVWREVRADSASPKASRPS